MVAICCFQCDPRLATYMIAVLSTLHYSVEVVLLSHLDTEHRLVAEDDGIKFYTVFATHIFLLVASVLLFYSAYSLVRLYSIPWLLGCIFNLIIYFALLIIIFMRYVTTGSTVELEKTLFIFLAAITLSYCMWIVFVFFQELGKDYLPDEEGGGTRKRPKSVFTLYYTDDEGAANDEEGGTFRSNKRSSGTKMTSSERDDARPLLLADWLTDFKVK